MNPSAFALRHSGALTIAVAASIAWGTWSLATLPRQEEPRLTWRLANVVTRLPGATPERVEALITDVLERRIEEVDEVEHIYSVSRPGLSLVQIELSDGVTIAAPVWQKVRHKLAESAGELPAGVNGPDLDDEIMGTFSQLIAFSGHASHPELKDHAERLEDRLRYLPGTASTTLFGVQPEVIEIEVDPVEMAAHDLNFDLIAEVLRRRNVKRPAGRQRLGSREVLIEASGEFASEFELSEMLLLVTAEGRALRLGDVAAIRRATQDPPEPLARIDGRPAVMVGVRGRPGERLDRFGEAVAEIVAGYSAGLPESVRCEVVHDLARYTRRRAGQLGRTLLLSISFVFATTSLFMGWRAASVVTAVIPLTGLIVLVCFSIAAIPLNEMSVMAIIMAFGLLVDDAIVVTEQVHRRGERGVAIERAAAEEPGRLFVPLLVTTLTTIAAFLPIYLLPGGVGEFVRAIPVGVAICLAAALIVSMTVVPYLCARLMVPRRVARDGPRGGPVGRLRGWSAVGYRSILARTVARPTPSLLIAVVVMVLLALPGLRLRRDFFSPVERDQFIVDVFAPQGSALRHTARLVENIEAEIASIENVVNTASFVGRNAPLIFYNLESQETFANHFAQLVVRVDDPRNTARAAARVEARLRETVADAQCVARILEHGAPLMAPFELRISGPSLETLRELGRRAVMILKATEGVRGARDNHGNMSVKIVARVNEPVARRVGLDQRLVADELRRRLDGFTVGYLREGEERIGLSLRVPSADRGGDSSPRAAYFKPSPAAGLIPFAAVARLEPKWEVSSIYRRDGRRALSVLAYPEFGLTAAQVAKRFSRPLAALEATLPAGYTLQLGGENEQRRDAELHLMTNGVYAVFLILLLLTYEFRTPSLTVLILIVVPLSLAGVLLALFLTGWPLNFMAIMGMMVLFGVVINDAVILVDGYEQRRRAGQPIDEVVIEGTLDRSRHVVITTATTVAGFLPLALAPSLLWPPLAIAIIGGISMSTLVTLVVIPAAYTLLNRRLAVAEAA